MSYSKYVIGGLVVVTCKDYQNLTNIVGAGLYYLIKDDGSDIKFDSREHTLEKLH